MVTGTVGAYATAVTQPTEPRHGPAPQPAPIIWIRRPRRAGPPPFRLRSQLWIALFGGPLPLLVIGMMNATRLGLSARRRAWLLQLGLAAVASTVAVYFIIYRATGGELPTAADWPRTRMLMQGAYRLIALVLWVAYDRIQLPGDERFQATGGRYASLWLTGIAVIIVCALVQLPLVAITPWSLRR